MSDPIADIQKHQEKLENDLQIARQERNKWRDKYRYYYQRYEEVLNQLEEDKNESELEYYREQYNVILTKWNFDKRKLKDIQKIIQKDF
ncbi:hypothetical protein [Virgibacillus sp. CBA3643]|uniref:hypothetical protein n=1 Tax=Virgibacillus sp. CBA3643 TaxID=2942278 RepID=UPI0035A3828B